MSPTPEADPKDLSLTDYSVEELDVAEGPTLDSSDEFPLPSFDLDDGVDADVLFPLEERDAAEKDEEVGEATREDEPVVTDKNREMSAMRSNVAKKRYPALPTVSLSDQDLSDYSSHNYPDDEPFSSSRRRASSRLDFPDDTLDADYFEEGLDDDEKYRPTKPKRAFNTEAVSETRVSPPEAPVERPSTLEETSAEVSPTLAPVPAPATSATSEPGSPDSLGKSQGAREPSPEKSGRSMKLKRHADKKVFVRPWLPAAGVVLLAGAFFATPPLFENMHRMRVVTPARVVASQPQGEVFLGEESLGQAPVSLTQAQAQEEVTIRKEGYVALSVPPLQKAPEGPVDKFVQPLTPAPVSLSWSGLPEGSAVFWNGQKTDISKLNQVKPGTYSLKVKLPNRPNVTLPLQVEPRGSGVGPVEVGESVSELFSKQPQLELTLAGTDPKTKAKSLSLNVRSLAEGTDFQSKLSVSSGDKPKVILPAPGKYKVSFAGDSAFKPTSQTVEVAEGGLENVSLKLAKQPAPVQTSEPIRPSYRPERPSYQPTYRPTYRPSGGGGGGGGGGRIRPPAF
jgi:hypothetical protein